MFLSKKASLIKIINNLKTKVNSLNSEVDNEIKVRDIMLHNEQKTTRILRSEILKAKDVLLNNDLIFKAKSMLKDLVNFTEEDKVFLEGGDLHDMLEREDAHRQTFEYAKNLKDKHKKAKEARSRCQSNQIQFRNLNTLGSLVGSMHPSILSEEEAHD
jgi:hypothetical protein